MAIDPRTRQNEYIYPDDRPEIPSELPSEMPAELPAETGASIPIEYLTNQEAVEMVSSRKSASEQFRQLRKGVWDKCWDNFNQVYNKAGKEAWQSTIFQPETPKVVEVITANLYSTVLGPEVPAEWVCKKKQYQDNVDKINEIIKNDVQRSGFKESLVEIIREMCITGTGVGKVEYELDEEVAMVKSRPQVPMIERALAMVRGLPPPQRADVFEPKLVKTKDHAKIKYVDLYNFFWQPHTTAIDKDHWVIEEDTITNKELVELASHPDPYYRIDMLPDDLLLGGAKDAKEDNPDLAEKEDSLGHSEFTQKYYDPDIPHQRLQYWGPTPAWMLDSEKKDDPDAKYKSVNGWIWIIDGKWCVYKRLNPYHDGAPPYFKFEYIKVPGRWDGLGPAELMMFLQDELNEATNTGWDQVNLSLQKILAINKDKVPADLWNRLVSKPAAIWQFENIDDIRKAFQIIDFPPLLQDFYMRIEMILRAIQEVTGAVKATVGVGGVEEEAGGGTATGQLMNKQAAGERFMLYAKSLESSGLSDAQRKYYHRIYQFKTFESVTEILGEEKAQEFEYIPPQILEGIAKLMPKGVMSYESKRTKVKVMMEFYRMFSQCPWFKAYEGAREIIDASEMIDPDKLTFTDDEMQQFMQMRSQMMSQGALPGPVPGGPPGPGGAGGPPGSPPGSPLGRPAPGPGGPGGLGPGGPSPNGGRPQVRPSPASVGR